MDVTIAADVREVTVRRDGRTLVDEVTLQIRHGEVLGLLGPNGAGKSTLLRALAGLTPPDGGSIRIGDEALASIPPRVLAREMAFLPQHAPLHWPLPVRRVVALGRLPHRGPWQREDSADRIAITNAMTATDVTHLADRPVTQLSGGERARVLLARSLAGQPRILLTDEPVSGLDPAHQIDVMTVLVDQARQNAAVVVVLHDLALAMRFCHRLILLDQGRIHAEGRPEDVLTDDHVAKVYAVDTLRGRHDDQNWLLPWRRLPTG